MNASELELATREVSPAGWERRFCTNGSCSAERFITKRHPSLKDLWLVASGEESRPVQIATESPVCPLCGTTLLPTREKDGRLN